MLATVLSLGSSTERRSDEGPVVTSPARQPARPPPSSARIRHQPQLQLLVLEHHPGGLSTETDSGPLPERPLLAPWLRRAESPDGALLLEYADEIVAVDGDASVLQLLDGTRTLAELDPVERNAV